MSLADMANQNCCQKNSCKCSHSKTKKIVKKKKLKEKVRLVSSNSKRLQRMSVRPVHYLILSKLRYKHVLSKSNLNSFDRQIAKGLEAIKTSKEKQLLKEILPKRQRKTAVNWSTHENWLKRNSKPRYVNKKKRRKIKRKIKTRPVSQRVLHLAKPMKPRKKFKPLMRAKTGVRRSALKAKPSERIIKLSEALTRFRRAKYDYDHSVKSTVTPNALTCKPRSRISSLAQPKKYKKEKVKPMTPRGVSIAALKYKLKDRILDISGPKKPYVPPEDPEGIVLADREYTDFGVVQSALKYEASENILNISKPRVIQQPFVMADDTPRSKYNIAISALKYKASNRILEMSKPREMPSD